MLRVTSIKSLQFFLSTFSFFFKNLSHLIRFFRAALQEIMIFRTLAEKSCQFPVVNTSLLLLNCKSTLSVFRKKPMELQNTLRFMTFDKMVEVHWLVIFSIRASSRWVYFQKGLISPLHSWHSLRAIVIKNRIYESITRKYLWSHKTNSSNVTFNWVFCSDDWCEHRINSYT